MIFNREYTHHEFRRHHLLLEPPPPPQLRLVDPGDGIADGGIIIDCCYCSTVFDSQRGEDVVGIGILAIIADY